MDPIVITEGNFDEEVLKAEGKVLVDFWATWCGPCRTMTPIIKEVANEEHEGLKVCTLDVDDNQSIAMRYRVMSVPSFLVFENGEVVNSGIGAMPKTSVLKLAGIEE